MCKASIVAKHVTDAREGERYQIGISSHGLGALHPEGATTAECVACVKHGATLTLTGIPAELRQKHGIREREIVGFIDTKNNRQDLLEFGGRQIPLLEFANRGIAAYVGVPEVVHLAAPMPTLPREAVPPERLPSPSEAEGRTRARAQCARAHLFLPSSSPVELRAFRGYTAGRRAVSSFTRV